MLIKFVKLELRFSRETECPNLGSWRLVSCMNIITSTFHSAWLQRKITMYRRLLVMFIRSSIVLTRTSGRWRDGWAGPCSDLVHRVNILIFHRTGDGFVGVLSDRGGLNFYLGQQFYLKLHLAMRIPRRHLKIFAFLVWSILLSTDWSYWSATFEPSVDPPVQSVINWGDLWRWKGLVDGSFKVMLIVLKVSPQFCYDLWWV